MPQTSQLFVAPLYVSLCATKHRNCLYNPEFPDPIEYLKNFIYVSSLSQEASFFFLEDISFAFLHYVRESAVLICILRRGYPD